MRHAMPWLAVAISLLVWTGARAQTDPDVVDLLRGEPDIEALQRAAVAHVDARPKLLESLARDARVMGALPDLTLDGSTSLDRGVDRDALDHVEGSNDDRSWDLSVELEWDLSDLAMSYERVRALSEQQRRMELRDLVVTQVTEAYYDRQRARARLQFDPAVTFEERVLLELEILEHTARLDGLTDGAFSRMLQEDRRDP